MCGVYGARRQEASNLRAARVWRMDTFKPTDAGTRLAISMGHHCTMRRIVLLFLASLFLAVSGSAQGPAAADNKELLTLIDQVRAQQEQIADNQTKIDEKLADVMEAVRQARIFAGQGEIMRFTTSCFVSILLGAAIGPSLNAQQPSQPQLVIQAANTGQPQRR